MMSKLYNFHAQSVPWSWTISVMYVQLNEVIGLKKSCGCFGPDGVGGNVSWNKYQLALQWDDHVTI